MNLEKISMNKTMLILSMSALTIILSGCVTSPMASPTAAENRNAKMEANSARTAEQKQICSSNLRKKYAGLFNTIFSYNKDPDNLRKMRINRTITDKEEVIILNHHAEATLCRTSYIDGYSNVHSSFAHLITKYYAENDGVLIKLLDRKITIAELNQYFNSVKQKRKAEWHAASVKINTELNMNHNNEMAGRHQQAEASARRYEQQSERWAQYYRDQQNSLTQRRQRTITTDTNCKNVYGTIKCRSTTR